MANQTEIGELSINLKMRLEGLEKGIETAKKKLQEMEQENEKIKNSNKGVDASFVAMAAGIVASLAKIKSAVDDGVQKYKEYESANKGLESIVKGQGLSFNKAKTFIDDYVSDGLIPLSDATLAYKNLASRGYNEEQIKKTMIALKDAAAFGRQSTYEYGQAIATATEGLKNENSILVDNAGVTKNVAKMWEDYAKSIGKSTNNLTQQEKIQAEVMGIQEESKNQIGDAAKYAETYAGQQAQLNATNIEFSKTIGESMIPTLKELSSLQESLTKGLAQFMGNNKTLTASVITFTTTLLGAVVAITAVKKAYVAYKAAAVAADMTTKAFTASLLTNPVTLIAVGIAAVVGGLTAFNTKMQESIDKMNEATEASNNLSEAMENWRNNGMTYTESERSVVDEERKKAEDIVKTYEEKKNKIEEIENKIKEITNSNKLGFQKEGEINALNIQLRGAQNALKDFEKENLSGGKTIDSYRKKVETLNKTLDFSDSKQKYLTLTNQKAHRETLINIAQTKADINGKQKLLNILKEGKTTTEEYANAKSQLVKVYPELANVNENTIKSTQEMIDAESLAADAEWANAQKAIQASILEVSAMKSNSEQIKTIAAATQQSVEQVTASLQTQIDVLANLAKLTPEDFKESVTTNYTPKVSTGGSGRAKSSGGSKSYQNKKLDNYKELIEYKKSMDQISLKQEIKMYQTALKKYAKTTSEKRDLRVKLHELEKELSDAEAERLQKNLEKQVSAVEDSVDKKIKAEGAAYDPKERQKDYDKLISVHQKYLDKVLKSTKISSDKKKEIYKEELEAIRDYETEKRSLMVESVDNTVSQLTNAITKRLEELEETEKKIVENNIKLVESWKEARINAINEEYNARIDAIQKELDLLDKSEEEKTRAEEDAEYERKRNRLQDLIDFEHDATNRANYQKELDKLVVDYQKTLDKRALDDKKEALRAEQDLLKEQQSSLIEATENEADAQKEQYENQITAIEDYYKKQQDNAQKTAEKMLLNVKDNQSQILSLLKNYGDEYEITGQSLGEKLAQGINKGLADKIQSVIQTLQDTIDTNLERKIMSWTGTGSQAISGSNVSSKSVVVNQNNYIQQNPEMPSETYRKLKTIDENLAAQLAGV